MPKQNTVKSSAYYLQKWEEVEDLIAEEYAKFAGVARAENGEDQLDLDDRIGELRKLSDYYKCKYQEAYDSENGVPKNTRLRTYIWGN